MNITFCSTDPDAAEWLQDLRDAMPQATVQAWQPGAPAAAHAVVRMPPQQFFDEQPGLRSIFNVGAGVDALTKLRLPAGAMLVRLDDAGMAVQMAEFVCQAVIRYFRGLDACAADQREAAWRSRPVMARSQCSVGILGLGVLGQRVAQALRLFEFPVRAWSRSPKSIDGVECFAGDAQLPEFLHGTRVLVCLLPLTPDTRDILRSETLRHMAPGGYLVNVARGAHLVEEDLLALLDSGHLAGAALDVFRTEPLPPEHPFWRRPEITVTPHMSAQTLRDVAIAQIAGKLRALERGEPITGVVAPGLGY